MELEYLLGLHSEPLSGRALRATARERVLRGVTPEGLSGLRSLSETEGKDRELLEFTLQFPLLVKSELDQRIIPRKRKAIIDLLPNLASLHPQFVVGFFEREFNKSLAGKGIYGDVHSDITNALFWSLGAVADIDQEAYLRLYNQAFQAIASRDLDVSSDLDLSGDPERAMARSIGKLASTNIELFLKLYEQGLQSDNFSIIVGTAHSLHSLASIHPDLFIQQFDLKTKTAKEQPNERDHIIAEATTYCLEDIDPTGFTHAQFSQFFERGINSGKFSLTSEALKMLGKFAKKHPASARQFYEQSLQDERAHVRNYTVSSLVDLAEVDPEAFLELYRKAASMYDGKANKDSLIPGLAAVVPLDEGLYLRFYHEFLALEDEEHYEEDGIRYAYSPRKAEVAATVKELIQSNLQLAIELIEKGLRSENKAVRSGSASCIDYLFEKDKEAAIKLYELVGETSAETPGPSSLTGLSTVNPGKFVELYKERLKSNPKETLSNLSLFWTLIGIDTQLAESIIRQYLPERNEEDLQIIPFLSLTLEEIFKASPRSYLRLYYELLGNSDYEYDASQSLKKVASAADLSSLKKLFDNLGIQPNEIFPACRFLLLRLSRNENLDGFVENIVHIRALNELRQRISDDQSIESWFKQAFEIEVEKLFAIGEVTAETVDSLALLLSYGIFPTEQLRKFMSEQGEAGLASLRELKEKTKSGALVPENRLQADLEFSEYLKLIGDSTKNTTYEDFTKLRFVTEDEEVLDLSMSERMEAEAAAFEAARLFWFIKERLDRGRKVHVVGNERYGSAFVVNPLRRHLEDVGVNISFYRIPSTSVSKDQASEKIFSYWFTNELIQNRPDVIIIDGTRTPYDEKGLPRLPRAMVGYLNWFIAFNKACGVLDVKIANHISALEKDITFKLVVATMSQMGARAAYKVAHWTATSHDQISYGGDLVTNYSAPGYDDAPHVIFANPVIEPEKYSELPEYLKEHKAGALDDPDTIVEERTEIVFTKTGVKKLYEGKTEEQFVILIQEEIERALPKMLKLSYPNRT